MDGPDIVDALALRLYDAAVEPDLWPELLAEISAHTRCQGAQFLLWDNIENGLAFAAYSGADPAIERPYRDHYGAIDPRRTATERMPAGAVFRCHERFDDEFVRRSEFYNDYLIPMDVPRFAMAAKLACEEEVSAFLVFGRNVRQGLFDANDDATFRRFIPHATRAARISRRFMQLRAVEQRLGAALDRVSWGVIITDAHGAVLIANSAAEAIITAGDGLATASGQLAAQKPSDAAKLAALIHHTALAGDAGVDQVGGALAIARASGLGPLNLLAAPLPASAGQRYGLQPRGSVILFVTDPERAGRTPAFVLSSLYGLTPAEARVALALADGLSIEQIAEAQDRRQNTVRMQVKSALAKTGAGRQAELVRLILSLAIPNGP